MTLYNKLYMQFCDISNVMLMDCNVCISMNPSKLGPTYLFDYKVLKIILDGEFQRLLMDHMLWWALMYA